MIMVVNSVVSGYLPASIKNLSMSIILNCPKYFVLAFFNFYPYNVWSIAARALFKSGVSIIRCGFWMICSSADSRVAGLVFCLLQIRRFDSAVQVVGVAGKSAGTGSKSNVFEK